MGLVIGIDVGGSTTKIVGVNGSDIITPLCVRASDPVASLFGALGKYLTINEISLSDIEEIILTGVGSAFIEKPLLGIPTARTDEFLANGLGARFTIDLQEMIVVSMGTGTSFVKVKGDSVAHIGGTGIGGGTLLGLSRLLLKTQKIDTIAELASRGNINNIDLLIQDICSKPLPGLPLDATASNFGKVDGNASPEDLASGIIHLVLRAIGQSAILSAVNSNIKDFVLIGNLTKIPQCREIFQKIEELYKVRFHIPQYSEYSTAIGAALAYQKREGIESIL
ncbi:type II pantothenate kinase [Bacteroides propionicifaciens]|jgi:type II pantothenate kinase|uniref:type II pantothenate kinase n=1 Tax=Bacteroides propionicifaciens TaxID=392838 RepID=UPI0003804D9C|nr:type II pantothenate kinase [Bacteroides propionicifaciens]